METNKKGEFIARIFDKESNLDFGRVGVDGFSGRYYLSELFVKDKKMETYTEFEITREMYRSAVDNKEIRIEGIVYNLDDHTEDFTDNVSIKTIILSEKAAKKELAVTPVDIYKINFKIKEYTNNRIKKAEEKIENQYKCLLNTRKVDSWGAGSMTFYEKQLMERRELKRTCNKILKWAPPLTALVLGIIIGVLI